MITVFLHFSYLSVHPYRPLWYVPDLRERGLYHSEYIQCMFERVNKPSSKYLDYLFLVATLLRSKIQVTTLHVDMVCQYLLIHRY